MSEKGFSQAASPSLRKWFFRHALYIFYWNFIHAKSPFLDTIPHLFFSSLNYKFNPLFLLFSRILSALRAVYTAPFISVQFILYMQKRNVLSKSFLFVCRLFYFSNFSITHVCVFVFLSWHSPQLKQGDSCFFHYCNKRVFAECTVMPASPIRHPTVRRKKSPAAQSTSPLFT